MKAKALVAIVALCAFVSPAAAGSATLRKSSDGHWRAEAKVNGRPTRFLVDTGASAVALTLADARRAGIDVKALRYDVPVATANGASRAASVRLARVEVGAVRVENVSAFVIERGLDVSLLGMSFLGRLDKFEVRDGGVLRLED